MLGSKFADSSVLKYYESDDEKDNAVTVLVKKFKLKLSFRKNNDFSKDVIICDDYNFDPTVLSRQDSLIKIAIVKNNPNEWIKSQNLDNYDYIFALKEHSMLLNEYHVYNINEDCVYNHVKDIFNELHKRKSEKFHQFIKNTGFDNVFPKRKHYFKIFNSQYFNEQWYKDMYDIKDNTDAVIHFLLIGHVKGYDPSPDFSTNEYFQCNLDVKQKDMNPLLHYELYGRKENRLTHISDMAERNYSAILNSPLFDKEWYKNTYDIKEDGDLAKHYLTVGCEKLYNPGPDFCTYAYWESNLDIKEIKMNPLVHYELYGRKENRPIDYLEWRMERNEKALRNSPYFDQEWYKSTYDIQKEDSNPLTHYLKIGYVKGYNPGPDFSTEEYYECNPDVREYGMNPLVHYEVYGRNENREIHL